MNIYIAVRELETCGQTETAYFMHTHERNK